jgi:hypothetical protein
LIRGLINLLDILVVQRSNPPKDIDLFLVEVHTWLRRQRHRRPQRSRYRPFTVIDGGRNTGKVN